MRILVTGASGLIGSALVPALERGGHGVIRAVRGRPAGAGETRWDPGSGRLEPRRQVDAVVHLASQTLAGWRWTAGVRRRARESRVEATRALCEHLAASGPPSVLLAASAIGIYGDRGDERLVESSPPGAGFLADLVRAWEAASDPLARAGTRVVHLRLGLVLAAGSGALGQMLLPFRLGLGGPLGGGRQYWSWVGLDDAVGAFQHCLEHADLSGPVNVVSPEPVPQRRFAKILGAVLGRPAVLPAPAFALRLAMGEMADALILSSERVLPDRLVASGYRFRHPDLERALRAALGPGA